GEGDYLIIGFGHNDEKSDDKARFTDPKPDYKTAETSKAPSFQYTLYENYVKLAKEKGATPVLCTPIVRYADDGVYEGKSVSHVTADGDYAQAVIKLGADTGTAVVDLTKITREYYTAHNADAKDFHAFTTYSGADKTPDGMDKTHINKFGAKQIAYWLLTNLPKDCPLTAHVKADKAPDKAVDYPDAINKSYKKPDYDGFNPSAHTALATTTANGKSVSWYKTAMGVLGGDSKVADYSAVYADGKFTLTTGTGSKFAGTQDGFGAVFVQVDESKNFTAAAKAKVTGASTSLSAQNAFGMMLRDDIYINTNNTTIVSNFVSASVTGNGKALMSRTVNTALDYGDPLAFTQNVEYELTITRVGQV
ncbi:MAG: hypothetical protein K2N18_03515, partial [Clostridia bacterium]|nr:hypothetical protein [Clostridia bacterium]